MLDDAEFCVFSCLMSTIDSQTARDQGAGRRGPTDAGGTARRTVSKMKEAGTDAWRVFSALAEGEAVL